VELVYTRAPELFRYYVDSRAAPGNDGRSWANAFKYLQDALNVPSCACEVREIFVAQGIYKPDEGIGITPGDRTATFQLKNCVSIKGGYAGIGAPDPNIRDIELYNTILSGDLRSNDIDINDVFTLFVEPSRSENSYHIVTGSDSNEMATLDGFTIVGGNANGTGIDGKGGGMYNKLGSPRIKNCIFMWNSAVDGGGIYNESDSKPMLTNCIFNGNDANNNGGGMENSGSNPTLINCTFSQNWAGQGGGLYNEGDSNSVLTNCIFNGNSANNGGGGMENSGSNPTLTDCTFSENKAVKGGGIYNEVSSKPTLTNCIFSNNSANDSGGGMDNSSSNPTLTDCKFSENCAGQGGGMQNYQSIPYLSNCTFSGNSADNNGGAIYNSQSSPQLNDCIFTGNWAGENGGGMYNSDSIPLLRYCTFCQGWTVNGNGGGVYNLNSTPKIECCTFSGNIAETDGGGIYNSNSNSYILSCVLSGNWAKVNGGALRNQRSRPEVINCTIIGNRAIVNGGGTYSDNSSRPTLTNCILWKNNPDQINGLDTVTYSDIEGGRNGEHNINSDPCFVRPGYWDQNSAPDNPNDDFWIDGDYHLLPGSCCIDCGKNDAIPFDKADCDDQTRIINSIVDLGAYEFAETGIGSLTEALDTTLSFASGGAANWFYQTAISFYDGDAAQSGNISHNEESWIQTRVNGPGTLKFFWKVESEFFGDYLEFYIDGLRWIQISGLVNWRQNIYSLTSGLHTLKWRYIKNRGGLDSGNDSGWVDKVEWMPEEQEPQLPPPSGSLSEAVDTNLDFLTGGSSDWFYQTIISYHDGDAAQSGIISHNEESWIQTTVNGPGMLNFYWKVSSETNYDSLEFYFDGSVKKRISGLVDWEEEVYSISSGSHTFKWRYIKDGSKSSGSDCGWLDWVRVDLF
jgi:parallel beta-helix repeat protein/predicted outer membrane repeat protein